MGGGREKEGGEVKEGERNREGGREEEGGRERGGEEMDDSLTIMPRRGRVGIFRNVVLYLFLV